jgi:protein phosphatase
MYAVLDTESGDITYKRFRYDNNETWRQIREVVQEGSPYLDQLRKFYF